MPRTAWILLLAILLTTSSSALPAEKTEANVVFVPTPHRVVREMLKLADVKKDDIVYDLGSGDGRVVIAAARDFAARGVGIEIDRELVSESIENARQARVTERTSFHTQDMFKADLHDATVVTLFLLPDINKMLVPKLLKELEPGSRIVSHLFDMGDWKPDMTLKAYHSMLYCWIVPAHVEGAWNISLVNEKGPWQCTVTIHQDYQEVRASGRNEGVTFREMKLRGQKITMLIEDDSPTRKSFIALEGLVQGDTMEGVAHTTGDPSGAKHPWKGVRLTGRQHDER